MTPLVTEQIDWQEFLSRHDLVWKRIPSSWLEAAFLGNGQLAMSMWREPGENALRFAVDRGDVYDRRDESWGWCAYSRPRYHVGDFQLHPAGEIVGIDMRQDLYKAELHGTLQTRKGDIRFRAFVHATEDVMAVELATTEGERDCRWAWRPYEARTTRDNGGVKTDADARKYEENYGKRARVWVPNPDPERRREGDTELCVQRLLAGGGYTTAWREVQTSPDKRALHISIAMSHPELTSPNEARKTVDAAARAGVPNLLESHRAWWRAYYPASFVSIPDTRVESFYWILMYTYACAARPDTGVIDTHGPWFQPTGWPYTTMDMNTQISYWTPMPANRLEVANSLCNGLDKHFDNLVRNVRPVEYQEDSAAVGLATQQDFIAPIDGDKRYRWCLSNLPWLCHNYWLRYRYSMDDERLRKGLFPLLRRAINLYLHHLEEGEDGKLHLRQTFSPEYGYANEGLTRDCHIDLALLKWGCQALLYSCERLGVDDPLIPRWREVVERLVDFPTDEYGFMVGRDIPFRHEHRHLAHLMAIHPLYLVNWDQPKSRELIKRSLERSTRDKLAGDYCNFTAAWATPMFASMGDRENAYKQLMIGLNTMFPNTMFAFSGQNIETPLVTANAIHELLAQSWGDKVRVFHAAPEAWPNLVIHNVRTEGAFLISAVRENGNTRWIRIKSLAGEPCRIMTDMRPPLAVVAGPKVKVRSLGDGGFDVDLRKDQEIVIAPQGSRPDLTIAPLPAQDGRANSWGLP